MENDKFKVFKTIKRIIDIVIVVIIAVYVSTILIQRVSGNKSVLGLRVFNVASQSMEPVYMVNDVIAVKNCNPNTLKVGEDIVYIGRKANLAGKIVTHRIIKIENKNGVREITTKGVNNDLVDPSITTDQVLGKVMGKIPLISLINKIIMTQAGFYFLIFVPIVILISMEIAETIIEAKIEKKELIEIKDN